MGEFTRKSKGLWQMGGGLPPSVAVGCVLARTAAGGGACEHAPYFGNQMLTMARQ